MLHLFKRSIFYVCVFLAANCIDACPIDPQYPLITVRNGTLMGKAVRVKTMTVWNFLGIPYAQPPVRFARPQPVAKKWIGVFDATKTPKACQQDFSELPREFNYTEHSLSEDCLILNVFVPNSALSMTSLPVMVWIHGGAFKSGTTYPYYDATFLSAQGNVIVVTIQYRLNAFGWWTPDVRKGGNWGLWDQQLALRWVHENIAAFGGNNQLVTVFGQSAGSASISLHLHNTHSRSLFQRVILMSGPGFAPWAVTGQAETFAKLNRQTAASLGCKDAATMVACMRKIPVKKILKAFRERMLWSPVVDGDFISEMPREASLASLSNHDIMLGVLKEEGWSLLRKLQSYFINVKVFVNFVFKDYPELFSPIRDNVKKAITERIKTQIGNNSDRNYFLFVIMRALSESFFFCPAKKEADVYTQHRNRVFVYNFVHRSSFSSLRFSPTHSEELHYLFGNYRRKAFKLRFTEEEKAISNSMIEYWTKFAREGEPNRGQWKPYTSQNKEYLSFGVKQRMKKYFYNATHHTCAFWEQFNH